MSTFNTNENTLLLDDDALAHVDGGFNLVPFEPGPVEPFNPTNAVKAIVGLPLGPGIALPPGFSNLPLGPGIALPPTSGNTGS
ncbi:hypothetical protein SAMN02745172_00976 [Pseudoxanthobacter soli DSM 19599]|uniref:Uncharacterized protein n=1 Tax=Pseudoxanthobacter soli DSM 19599 TaxID=1123029 RepID=A0A1M7ZBT3_9HYPH|nr:hypothetical protein [Pseudoxanthobacter soli]SHO62371.1 hypothetical protein SAMN02745172_00976 [Pseudoxanthobacter soli DSM 19599]